MAKNKRIVGLLLWIACQEPKVWEYLFEYDQFDNLNSIPKLVTED